jgi:hypothetical protein
MIVMAVFQQEHDLDHQPYTEALGSDNPVGDEEWRASAAYKSSASGTDMGMLGGRGNTQYSSSQPWDTV